LKVPGELQSLVVSITTHIKVYETTALQDKKNYATTFI